MIDSTQFAGQTPESEFARNLATRHLPATEPDSQPLLLERLQAYERTLQHIYQEWAEQSAGEQLLSSAADWMLDNYYIVRQTISLLYEDLPPQYYRELPQLARTGNRAIPHPYLPRVYILVRELLEHIELQPSMTPVINFLNAYQTDSPLTMGELWAVPSMLRYVFIERMTQAAAHLNGHIAELLPLPHDLLMPALDRTRADLGDHQVSSGEADDTPLHGLHRGDDDDQTVAEAFLGLRAINGTNWLEFFEAVSQVHHILLRDPAGIYGEMIDATRNRYRLEIEQLARYSRSHEVDVATRVVELARENAGAAGTDMSSHQQRELLPRASHIGYYLLDKGRAKLEGGIGYAPPLPLRLRRWVYAHPTLIYLGTIALLTIIALSALAIGAHSAGGVLWQAGLIVLLGIVPALTFAVSITHWLLTLFLPPRILPKLELPDGIPVSARTMVVIPALLSRIQDVDELFHQLELHCLRNPDPNGYLTFALLTDFADAPEAVCPEDSELLDYAKTTLARLNEKYSGQLFYFFHRKRLWNPGESAWMGWERKRGKLEEFNRLLRLSPSAANDGTGLDVQQTSFIVAEGDLSILHQIRYVITLDADTVLPRDSARSLVATITHPLNRAEFDPVSGRVIAGYTVLQPRTENNATAGPQSLFTQVFAGDTGIDLYTLAVSDVYQDLFGEGIFVGKGIYDVDAFRRSLTGRVPENSILSHDLFEGIHGRAGLVTDIVLFEQYPSHYLINVRRSHRWVRGDWQLLPWLGNHVPTQEGYVKNRLPLLARWKIVDNLRRSLLSPVLLLWFAAAWTVLPGAPWVWTLIGVLAPAIPIFSAAFAILARAASPNESSLSARPLWKSAMRWLLQLAFLPYEALINSHAIAITLLRVFVTRRDLLEWVTAANNARLLGENVLAETIAQQILPSLIVLIPIILITIWLRPSAIYAAFPLWILWAAAAEIARIISRPIIPPSYTPDEQERQELRVLARRTWLFYEQFVGPDDNWLPPDHFQESPKGTVAHRTSPTNVGLYLLCVLAAHDFGYISTGNFTVRVRAVFDALAQLPHHSGHIFNWFDTQTLDTLVPAYVSTVDSGNLAASLIVLKEGCYALGDQPLLRRQIWQGLLDALSMLMEAMVNQDMTGQDRVRQDKVDGDAARAAVMGQIAKWQEAISVVQSQKEKWSALLEQLTSEDLSHLDQAMLAYLDTASAGLDAEQMHTLQVYNAMLHRQITNIQFEIDLSRPWHFVYGNPPAFFGTGNLAEPIAKAWRGLRDVLPQELTLANAATEYRKIQAAVDHLQGELQRAANHSTAEALRDACQWSQELVEAVSASHEAIQGLVTELVCLAQEAERAVAAMDFGFIFDQQRKLFHIGFNATTGKLDANYYDLLASEARIASIVAIGKHDVPQSNWLYLGRPFRSVQGHQMLLSWSGTMFEYLMPLLLARSYPGTLLHDSCQEAVAEQQRYAQQHNVPWGISESGFYQFDSAQNYQYRAFGVPQLGLKRGLSEELVITPYASMLAIGLTPEAVLQNFARMKEEGLLGRYGLYEAADYSSQRLALGQEKGIVRSYMAHHQGMILLALANYLHGNVMVERFHKDLTVQSIDLLLQEQVPDAMPIDTLVQTDTVAPQRTRAVAPTTFSWSVPLESAYPLTHQLANGHLMSIITNGGSGFIRWNNTTLTRWRADTTLDNWGVWVYVQDMTTGASWPIGRRPAPSAASNEEVIFYPHMVEFRQTCGMLNVQMKVTIAADADVEIRHITLANSGDETLCLRLTSYGEVVLGDGASDLRHQAFAKLFIESEYLPQYNSLLFRRRPRSVTEHPPMMAHALVAPDGARTRVYESDRACFLGRGRTERNPAALARDSWLGGTTGATLDPIMALGEEIMIAPHNTTELAWLTLAGATQADVEQMLARFQSWPTVVRAFDIAELQTRTILSEQNLVAEDVRLFDQMLARLLYPHSSGRAEPTVLADNRLGQPGLWRFSISGDYPILLARLHEQQHSALLSKLLQAHRYWRQRGLMVDLVIANEEETNYGQEVQGAIWRLIHRTSADQYLNHPGGIFMIRRDQMHGDEYALIQTAARLLIDAKNGSLEEQVTGIIETPSVLPNLLTTLPVDANMDSNAQVVPPPDLQFNNGLGGFTTDGKEYVVYLEEGAMTPAPWINVIANEGFGFIAGESGSGYSWAGNSGENRLTAWRNDPVTDMPSEILYLRDEETGQVWSPTPLPAPSGKPYLVRHGLGYSVYEHQAYGLDQRVRLYVSPDAPVKFIQVRVHNQLSHVRRLTVTFYAEWVLGVDRAFSAPYILAEYAGDDTQALYATNPYNNEFGQCCAFVATDRPLHGFTTDRAEFLGRNGDYALPTALYRVGLSGDLQAGRDPCGVLQVHLDLAPDAEEEFIFLLGQGDNADHARDLVHRYCAAEAAGKAWSATSACWEQILGAIQVKTPEPSMDLLLNRWLLYQTTSCRLWGRSALYQSSGAFGFRDQLQDVMALFHTRPDLARNQLLAAARRQFEAGDVLHWWHPPSGRGVRTRISDDLLWLPYVTARYVATTGDTSVLDEAIPFLQGDPLSKDEDERYAQFTEDTETFSLYEHCRRALVKGITQGRHGLPLIGGGDWNDGMNRVGVEGEGESIWLGWFLYTTQIAFADVAEAVAVAEDAQWLRDQAAELKRALEAHSWDGEWYRRAYYDDGTPLGSAQNKECRIDSIAQSWAVLSGAADPARAKQAMDAVQEYLVREDDRLILLFTPPFNETRRDPGYIKGYLPGVRENGGQYTHAAIWSIWAWAKLGDGDLAHSLFQMINPICRSDSPDKVEHYKIEPYVISADVYGVAPHIGRGGWSWYTGSGGWMYRLGVEALLGLHVDAKYLWLDPCIPKSWPGFSLQLRVGSTQYNVTVDNSMGVQHGVLAVTLDGKTVEAGRVPLKDDGLSHEVGVTLGVMGQGNK